MDRNDIYKKIEFNQENIKKINSDLDQLKGERVQDKELVQHFERIMFDLKNNCSTKEINALYKKNKILISEELEMIEKDYQNQRELLEDSLKVLGKENDLLNNELFNERRENEKNNE